MTLSARLLDILSRTDAELRQLIEQLVSEGSYSDLEVAARMASALDALSHELRGEKPISSKEMSTSTSEPTIAPGVSRRRSARDYPRFKRDGDRLIKVAWSKRDRDEYEHRAPGRVVQMLVDTIRKKKGDGRIFEATDVMPIKDPSTRQEIPSYQSYLALAWLRHEGLVTKKGRDRYLLRAAATPARIAELWEALPTDS